MPDHTLSAPVEPALPLRQHHLDYIHNLRLGEEVLAHRDRVLAEASLVVRYMEPSQEHDPTRWFEEEVFEDPDYPSGRAVCTTVVNDTCVFLDSQRRCVLHMAESESPALKPFYCRAYPVAIVQGRVTLDTDWCPEETQCCGTIPD